MIQNYFDRYYIEARLRARGFHYTQRREWVSKGTNFVIRVSRSSVSLRAYKWPLSGLLFETSLSYEEALEFFLEMKYGDALEYLRATGHIRAR